MHSPLRVAPLLVLLLCLGALGFNDNGACPNDCSGHGRCSQENACICDTNWATAPDCSLAVCPSGYSWNGKPLHADTAHQSTECSNAGICNRGTGLCSCYDGFEGLACDRISCPNNCGEHGKCMTMGNVYKLYGTEFSTQTVFLPNATTVYSSWDAEKLSMCYCDIGYTGSACEMRMCPKGDDPLTPFSNYRTIVISLSATSRIGGNIQFWINGQNIMFPAHYASWSVALCQAAFAKFPNIEEVKCTRTQTITSSYGNVQWTVAFTKFPTVPFENNVYSNNGSLPISEMYCRTTYMTGTAATCTITDVTVATLPGEWLAC